MMNGCAFKNRRVLITIIIVLYATPALFAETRPVEFQAGLSVERLFGFTKYQIGGRYNSAAGGSGTIRFPVSELSFPLGVFITTLDLDLTVLEKFGISLKIKHNNFFGVQHFNSKAGKMKDSDW